MADKAKVDESKSAAACIGATKEFLENQLDALPNADGNEHDHVKGVRSVLRTALSLVNAELHIHEG